MNSQEIIQSLIEIREPELLFAVSYLNQADIDLVQQPDEAKQYLEQKADLGLPEAEFALARLLCVGAFGEIDQHSALKLYKRSIDRGYAPALVGLAHFYVNGWAGLSVDKNRATELLVEGADRGYSHAAAYLATAYAEGTLDTRDETKSRQYLELAAELGDVDSQFLLGSQLMDEENAAKEAESWLKLAANAGSAGAHKRLAGLYLVGGTGIAKNVELARKHHVKADEIEKHLDP